ncbi:hypothetical protein TNIN_391881 [Trichonephila inaurata madagascariensis]|uniref:Uncharacterized protein n=1 Tax=Trichonephila inaurata madagascariensis TaxID=2747483 RepID=A0A8X6X8L6_9ARAC|nr:hypothetical protein TNIN_391881 [Trichonephila inaurata madagascariensis]
METIRRCQQTCVDSLRQMPDHYPEEPFYTRALTELQEIEETMAVAVSDIDSFPPCTTPGCPHHEKNPVNSPTKKILTTPRNNNANNPGKRKDISSFEYPPLRKTARKIVLNHPVNEEINLSPNKYALSQDENDINPENPGSEVNKNNPPPQIRNPNTEPKNSTNQSTAQAQLPPPVMLLVEKNYKAQMAAITKEFPKIRSRLTGDFLKLYTDSSEERRLVYGHMANYKGCLFFPKPSKGAAKNKSNSYSNIYSSLVRPNVTYAQVANGASNSKSIPQMATRGLGFSAQTEARKTNPSSNRYNSNNNNFPNIPNFNHRSHFNNNNFNVQTTLQMTMHCLMQLSQILCNNNNLNSNNQQLNPNQIYPQIEASCNNINNNV